MCLLLADMSMSNFRREESQEKGIMHLIEWMNRVECRMNSAYERLKQSRNSANGRNLHGILCESEMREFLSVMKNFHGGWRFSGGANGGMMSLADISQNVVWNESSRLGLMDHAEWRYNFERLVQSGMRLFCFLFMIDNMDMVTRWRQFNEANQHPLDGLILFLHIAEDKNTNRGIMMHLREMTEALRNRLTRVVTGITNESEIEALETAYARAKGELNVYYDANRDTELMCENAVTQFYDSYWMEEFNYSRFIHNYEDVQIRRILKFLQDNAVYYYEIGRRNEGNLFTLFSMLYTEEHGPQLRSLLMEYIGLIYTHNSVYEHALWSLFH